MITIKDLQAQLNELESLEKESPELCAQQCRELLSRAVDYVYYRKEEEIPQKASLLELIDNTVVSEYIDDPDIINGMHFVRILGMNARHGGRVRRKDVKLARDNISYLIGFLAAKSSGRLDTYRKPPYMSEAATRRLYVDLYLREAGWEVASQENQVLPGKAGIEIEVHGMPSTSGIGYCDYVLYGRDSKPLAIVEVKKTSLSPEKGRHQVDLYAECMEKVYGYKPIMYYTNGYVTRIIDGLYPDRNVDAFHSINELELLLQRRSRKPITDFRVDENITGRPYQKMAITSLCEWLNDNHRRGLLVMATGTGKTRMAASLVDILTRNSWIKNVLFLADRITLVHQAKTAFNSLLPAMTVCELSGDDEDENGKKTKKDLNARLMFCTYQTMIRYIDAESKTFTTGRFDLIIIDEAHRSIFNRYGTIFRYFDSLLIGLTATPKNEVDANTYRVFGCEAGVPNFDYPLEQGVKEHYLVGYSVINRTSKILKEGIALKDLTDEERKQLELYLVGNPPTPDFTIKADVIFKYLYNVDTCKRVLEDLMKWGLKVDGGEKMGKTIIFAYNHKHAQMIVDTFHDTYPMFPPNTCQLVDYYVNYGENLVDKFKEDPEFRIAVSVDMMDTGVDVPPVLNLVFFKKVRSKIKFVQMIGRGTRLCENIFGPGKDKSEFLIFDYCGNFEYFHMHPDGKAPKEMLTLSQRLFNIRTDMLYELQRLEFQQDPVLRAYYLDIKKELHQQVVAIKANDKRIQVREAMMYVDKYYDKKTWDALTPVLVKELNTHITPLLESGLNGEFLSLSFDARVYYIELSILKTGKIDSAAEHVKNIRLIAQYLANEKASIGEVLKKAAELKQVMSDSYWAGVDVPEMERMRKSIRDLMKYLKGSGPGQFDIDIADTITNAAFQPDVTSIDIRTYREKVIDYLAEHSDNPVIQKIHNLERINASDLKELEHILWHELGTEDEYKQTTSKDNLAVFVRSLIGLSQEAVNEKFSKYLDGNAFNSQQQEFIYTVINYVRENGDIELSDMVNSEPFNNFDLLEVFGDKVPLLREVVATLHDSIVAEAA